MLISMLREASAAHGSGMALVQGRRRVSYQELCDRVQSAAIRLADHGVGPGSRVCYAGDDAAGFAVSLFAAASLGAVLVAGLALDAPASGGGDGGDSNLCGADFLVVSAEPAMIERSRMARWALPSIALSEPAGGSDTPRAPLERQTGVVLAEPHPERAAAVLRSQANLAHEAHAVADALALSPSDRVVATLPVDRSPGLCLALLAAIRAHATVSLCAAAGRDVLRALLADSAPTVLITDCQTLATHLDGSEPWLGAVRTVVCPRLELDERVAEARARVPGKLLTFYHRPEAGLVALNSHASALDCLGDPLAGVRVSLERAAGTGLHGEAATWNFGSFVCFRTFPPILGEGSEPVSEPGVPGRIVIESPAMAAAAIRNGRVETPDRGFFDADGRLHLLPRGHAPAAARRSA